jgi:tRNA-dihydrouridine synthase A
MTSPHRLCIAPMMERTDRHFRYLMRQLAPHARLYTEMLTARALLHGDRERLLGFHADEHPVGLQLGGSEPEELAAAARLGAAAGYDEINLNVGCPSGRVQAGCFGVALMLQPERVARCVTAMREAVSLPVTVKTRIGVDHEDSYEFLRSFVETLASCGCRTIIVHARKAWLSGLSPKENREIPPLDYSRVHRLKLDFPALDVIINGGITAVDVALAQLDAVDGVMLGRAAYADPWLVAELDRAVFDRQGWRECRASQEQRAAGTASAPPRAAVLENFFDYAAAELERGVPLRAMTRHLLGFFSGEPGGRRWRREIGQLPDGARGLAALRRLADQYREPSRRAARMQLPFADARAAVG